MQNFGNFNFQKNLKILDRARKQIHKKASKDKKKKRRRRIAEDDDSSGSDFNPFSWVQKKLLINCQKRLKTALIFNPQHDTTFFLCTNKCSTLGMTSSIYESFIPFCRFHPHLSATIILL